MTINLINTLDSAFPLLEQLDEDIFKPMMLTLVALLVDRVWTPDSDIILNDQPIMMLLQPAIEDEVSRRHRRQEVNRQNASNSHKKSAALPSEAVASDRSSPKTKTDYKTKIENNNNLSVVVKMNDTELLSDKNPVGNKQDEFSVLKSLYPKQIDIDKAESFFCALDEETRQQVMTGLNKSIQWDYRFRQQEGHTPEHFVPLLTKYLKNEEWRWYLSFPQRDECILDETYRQDFEILAAMYPKKNENELEDAFRIYCYVNAEKNIGNEILMGLQHAMQYDRRFDPQSKQKFRFVPRLAKYLANHEWEKRWNTNVKSHVRKKRSTSPKSELQEQHQDIAEDCIDRVRSDFDDIAAAYPKSTNLDSAYEIYKRLHPDEQMKADILHGIEVSKEKDYRFQAQPGYSPIQFVPQLGKYLMGQEWKKISQIQYEDQSKHISNFPERNDSQNTFLDERAKKAVLELKKKYGRLATM